MEKLGEVSFPLYRCSEAEFDSFGDNGQIKHGFYFVDDKNIFILPYQKGEDCYNFEEERELLMSLSSDELIESVVRDPVVNEALLKVLLKPSVNKLVKLRKAGLI